MEKALEAALRFWRENLKTGRDNARIEQLLGRKLTGSWCGWFAQACYRAAGLIAGVDLGSVYRGRETARYRDSGLLKLWCVVKTGGKWESWRLKDYHTMRGGLRQLLKWDAANVRPGDIILHESKPGSSTGHVMIYQKPAVGAALVSYVGGNQKGVFPSGTKGTGITICERPKADPYFTWIVRLSPLDFDPGVKLCKTLGEAAKLAAKLNGGEA